MTHRAPYYLLAFLSIALPISSQTREHYALVLQDTPVTGRFASRAETQSLAAAAYRSQIETRQAAVRAELATRNFNVVGSVSTLANAVFVVSTADRVAEMRSISGVVEVVPMRKLRATLNKATALMNAPAAWQTLGGVTNAGAGIKIAIIDSGIDQKHPAFQDSSLKVPSGFPKCTTGHPEDCNYTNNKVIVARSYIRQQSAPASATNAAATSVPDDFSPRDRLGHGTATASVAAANVNTAGAVPFNGMAPKAFLGNYKVLGTGVENLYTVAFEDAVVQAIEDAFTDGMDIASCSLGVVALTPAAQDFMASAFEKAAQGGMVIAVSAGNDGANGQQFPTPTFNTISSPATAPSVIAAGATVNSHVFQPSVSVPGAPSNLQKISAQTSDGYYFGPYGQTSAALIDVASVGGNPYACSALPGFSLYGAYALIQRSPASDPNGCTFNTKATNAANAGATGIVFYMADGSAPFSPSTADSSGNIPLSGPVVMVSLADGTNLKTYVNAHSGAVAALDPNGTEQSLTDYSAEWQYSPALAANQLASYSSSGPSPGMILKPDIVATGGFDGDYAVLANSGMYVATQSYDPYGEIYSPNGYVAADGTSFAAPMVAGAAALVKQAHPNFTAAQIRSALINTSSQDTNVDDQGYTRGVTSFGAGRLDAGAAVSATVTANPPTISFGALSGSLPAATPVVITNAGAAAATLTVAATAPVALAGTSASGISVTVDQKTVTIPAGGTATVNVSLTGAVPGAGQYSGNITIQGTGVSLHIPYLFVVASNVVYDMFGIIDGGIYNINYYACFTGLPSTDLGADQRLIVKLIDSNGAPVTNTPVKFAIGNGRNTITLSSVAGMPACTPASSGSQVSCNTDSNGAAYAEVTTGTTVGASPTVDATNSGLDFQFGGCNAIIAAPTISGISDAATGATTVAPGSYISIYGKNLVDPGAVQNINQFGDPAPYLPFPITWDFVTVSFDVPGAYDGTPADYNGYAGRIVFMGGNGGQINLQVPWELQGASSVQVKVNVDGVANSNVFTLPLAQYAPTIFQANGIVAAIDATTGQIVTASNPARAGDVVELYANGLGPVNNQPATGDSSLSVAPFSTTKATPTVTIGGQSAAVSFSGLAPGNPGLYQINVTVPSVGSGNQAVALSIGGVSAPTATIPIK
jgi:uncharacterized protein (TIGR03437 family)